MKKFLLLPLFVLFGQFVSAQGPISIENLKQIDWLQGHWQCTNDRAGLKTTEFWTILPSKEMKGVGATTNPDTIFQETMTLKMAGNDLVLEVQQKNNNEITLFKVTQLDANGFICENPANYFPKKIQYQKNAQGFLATISNPGREVKFDFIKKPQP